MQKNKIWIFIILILVLCAFWFLYHDKYIENQKIAWTRLTLDEQENQATTPTYPIDSEVFTTVEKSIIPIDVFWSGAKLATYDIANFEKNGYGFRRYWSGVSYEKRFDLMWSGYTNIWVENLSKLLRFFVITDTHITDKESPAQWIFIWLKPFNIIGAYSPIMLYTTQVLDAAVQTINALNKKEKIDFVIALGDITNSSQYNELRWFIDIFDGKKINPDSWEKDDPISGPYNDYQDEFQSAWIDKSIPWYATIWNHDHFRVWSYIFTDRLKSALIDKNILKMWNIFKPGGFLSGTNYVWTIDWKTPYWTIVWTGVVADVKNPITVPSDSNRYSLSKRQWMSEFFNTSTFPLWHWFSQANIDNEFACYSFEPKSNLPIKVIVLDDLQSDEISKSYGHWSLDKKRYEWLINELDSGQAQGKLMIIAAHVPLWVEPLTSVLSWYQNAYVSQDDLLSKLHTYPNLLMWIAWHRHENTITAFKSPDPTHPELGFWEIETFSLRDFPQMFRTLDIVRNSDNTISIYATDIYPAVKKGSLAELSRRQGLAAHQILNHYKPIVPYNAELFKKLSPEMQEKIKEY